MNNENFHAVRRTCMSRICNREGIVWAKLSSYKHWPARIITEELRATHSDYKMADSYKKDTDDTLVCFFGTNDLSWVNAEKAVVPWKKGLSLSYHLPKKNRKKKKYSEEFIAAIGAVRKFCLERSDLPFAAEACW